MQNARPRNLYDALRALTLIELLVVIAIVLILAVIGMLNYNGVQMRAKVAAGKTNLRELSNALAAYRTDWNAYPRPTGAHASDPFGVFASSILTPLTTPIAYVSPVVFHDPFGLLALQTAQKNFSKGPLDPPTPLNEQRSLFYFFYPYFSYLIADAGLNHNAFCAASVGPDSRDSLIVYYPFPASLSSHAASYGIYSIQDTVYDPTNGTVSGGDIAAFGGEVNSPALVGGGRY